MELPKECSSQDALQALRDDFDFAFAILKHAAHHDVTSFTFSGLRVPAAVQGAREQSTALENREVAIEVTIFQDHLNDRITLLTQNTRMIREIWSINERTRLFREFELINNDTSAQALEETAQLVTSLFSREVGPVVAALCSSLQRRTCWLDARLSQAHRQGKPHSADFS
jgi:hypothetical protein